MNEDICDDYEIPEEIKNLLTNDFLYEFKNNFIQIFEVTREPKYPDFLHRESTIGWVKAFDLSCKKLNLDELSDYYGKLGWEERDMFDGDLGSMLVGKGIVEDDELVQYFIVNSELNMSPGKIAAQVAHVSTNITIDYAAKSEKSGKKMMNCRTERLFWGWFENNQPKIILRGKQKEMEKLMEQGWYYIRDNGRTEIPADSLTCIGFTPEYKSIMKPIVKRFQLL